MERDCGAWINMLSHKIKMRMNAALSDLGITGVQSRIMHFILVHCQDGTVFQKDVEDAFSLRRSTTTAILQLMEKNGIIIRESVPYDARLKSLVPTDKAARLDEQVRTRILEIDAMLTRDLSPGQQQLFMEIAAQMARNLDS